MSSLESALSSGSPLTPQSPAPPVVHLPMPLADAQGSPLFEGQNGTDFLERFGDLCEEHGVDELQRITPLPHYCSAGCAEVI